MTTRRPPAFATVVLDVDSTVSGVEGIDWLAQRRGGEVAARVVALTDRAMGGELPLEAVYGERLAAIRPSRADIDALAEAYIAAVAPHCRQTIASLGAHGTVVLLVSGGLRPAIAPLAAALGVLDERLHAVDIRFDDAGNYVGYDERSPLTTATGKPEVIRRLGLARPSLMVGDGATDLAAKPAVDAFAAFTGFATRDPVVAAADLTIASFRELFSFVVEHTRPSGI